MLIHYRSVVAKRSFAHPFLANTPCYNRTLVHTSQSLAGDDKDNNPKDTTESEKLKISEKKKQLLRAKFANFDFISIDSPPQHVTKPVKLKPEIDYKSLVKNRFRSNRDVADETKAEQKENYVKILENRFKELEARFKELESRLGKDKQLREELEKESGRIQPKDKTHDGLENTAALKMAQVDRKQTVRNESIEAGEKTHHAKVDKFDKSPALKIAQLIDRKERERVRSGSNEKGEKTQHEKTGSLENSAAFMIAQLIDRKEPVKEMNNLLESISNKPQEAIKSSPVSSDDELTSKFKPTKRKNEPKKKTSFNQPSTDDKKLQSLQHKDLKAGQTNVGQAEETKQKNTASIEQDNKISFIEILNKKLKEQQLFQTKTDISQQTTVDEKPIKEISPNKNAEETFLKKLSLEQLNIQEDPKATHSGGVYDLFHKLNSGKALSIFTQVRQSTSQSTQESPIWSMHSDEELKSAQEIPHLNGFDEMIKLTDEGKLWKFPIDNQQGMEQQEDARTPFHEHIFLEHHLERFPDIEPIQQFMSLAINGLSQNGFISLKEKVEIIDWYRNYFNEKIDLINEALQAEIKEREFKESLRKGAS